jgi:hypothetical protein
MTTEQLITLITVVSAPITTIGLVILALILPRLSPGALDIVSRVAHAAHIVVPAIEQESPTMPSALKKEQARIRVKALTKQTIDPIIIDTAIEAAVHDLKQETAQPPQPQRQFRTPPPTAK